MKTYKIIWADDEVYALLRGAEDNLKENNFELLEKCTCGQKLEEALEKHNNDRIDAVIVDANFPYMDEDSDFNDRNIDGLQSVAQIIKQYPKVPFYLFSGKGQLVKDLKEYVKKYFEPRQAIFDKSNGIEPLLARIKEDVEYRKTTQFVIENKFEKELQYAKAFDYLLGNTEAEKFIHNNLIRSYDCSFDFEKDRPQEILTAARKIIEAMFDMLKRSSLSIVPPLSDINGISRFLSGSEIKVEKVIYKLNDGDEIMPKPLTRSLWYCLDIVQDGSHLKEGLKLGVDKYITSTQNANLIRSILHIIIDLLRWFIEYVPNHKDNELNLLKWEVKHEEVN